MEIKNKFKRRHQVEPPIVDEAEIDILGIRVKMTRKTNLPIPYEFSVFIPRVELTQRVIKETTTTEHSIVLNSLTIVSAPRHEPSENSGELTKIERVTANNKV